MRKRIIKNLICIATMAIMLFGTLGMGVFAADPTVEGSDTSTNTSEQAQPGGDNPGGTVDGVTEEEPTVSTDQNEVIDNEALDEMNAQKDGEEDTVYLENVSGIKTLSGHRRIELQWDPVTGIAQEAAEPTEPTAEPEPTDPTDPTVEPEPEPTVKVTQYVIYRAPDKASFENFEEYAVIDVNEDGTVSGDTSSKAFDLNYSYCSDKGLKSTWTKKAIDPQVIEEGDSIKYVFQDGDVGDGLIDSHSGKTRGGIFQYYIIAKGTVTSDREVVEAESNPSDAKIVKDECVRTSFVKLKLKIKKKLKSHDDNKITKTFKKGTTIYTTAFGVGQYLFIYDDHMFYLNRVGTKSQKSLYGKNKVYSKEEAEYFINVQPDGRAKSKTKWLVWVNTYSQREYVFYGKEDNWELKYVWKICSGKAKSPTIRHIDPKNSNLHSGRKIGTSADVCKHKKTRHGIKWWNCFSSWNAMHGQRKGWKINGTPKSGGCVRNTNAHAKQIWGFGMHTQVIVF